MEVIDVLSFLESHPEGSFLDLVNFNGKNFGTCRITGVSPVWELHPDTDEFFYIIEGELEMTLLDNETPSHHVAPTGSSFVVPKGLWHKPGAPKGAKFLYFTPGETLLSEKENPLEEK